MSDRPNPLNLEVLSEGLANPALPDEIDALYERIKTANDARAQYVLKQEKLLRQRRGIRKPKVFPWPGANNHNWPLIDSVIRKWKPGITALVLRSDPVCYFFATNDRGQAGQPTAQAYYHWCFNAMPNVAKTMLELVEYIGQYGKAYTREGWEYRTSKQCRILQVKSLFPQGVDAAVAQYNQAVQQQRAQVEAAVAQGQVAPEAAAQIPPEVDGSTLVRQMLEDEFAMDPRRRDVGAQLDNATQLILQGAEQVRFYFQVVEADRLAWSALSPLQVIVPPRSRDVGSDDFVAIEHLLTADDLLKKVRDGFLLRAPVENLVTKLRTRATGDPTRNAGVGDLTSGSRAQIVDVFDRAEGITTADVDEPNLAQVLEIYCKLDLDGDGLLEKAVLWYAVDPSEDGSRILALYPYPYPFEDWPVTEFEFEHLGPRPYSARGIAELLSVFQATTNKLHNARLDAIQIVLSPMLIMRTTAGDEKRNIRFMPGGVIPVQNVADVAPLQMDTHGLIQNLQEENVTKSLAEQYIGIFDPSVLSSNAQERRTATEVEAVQNQTQSVFGQDAELFQTSMKKVHGHLWKLILEFAPEELWYRVTGEQNPRLAKKSEIAFDYDIQPSGTPANTSRSLAMARAREAIQLFGGDMTGLIDKRNLFQHYFNILDRNLSKRIVRSPEDASLIQMVMQQAAQANQGRLPAPPP